MPLTAEGLWVEPVAGPGAPALLIHPSLANRRALEPLAALLPGLAPAYIDLPGHGQSADVREGLLAAAARAAADALTVPGLVFGHSFGGVVALRAALDGLPVTRLVLFEPVLFAAAAGTAAYKAHEDGFGPVAEALTAGDTLEATRHFLALFGDGTPWEELPDRLRSSMAKRVWTIEAARADLVADQTGLLAPGGLEALDLPVLLLRGSRSHPVIADIHRTLGARLPRATEVVLVERGHMAPITHPHEVARAIRDWAPDLAADPRT